MRSGGGEGGLGVWAPGPWMWDARGPLAGLGCESVCKKLCSRQIENKTKIMMSNEYKQMRVKKIMSENVAVADSNRK